MAKIRNLAFAGAILSGILLSGCVSQSHSLRAYYVGASLLDAPSDPHLSWEDMDASLRPGELPTLFANLNERVSMGKEATSSLKIVKAVSDSLYQLLAEEWTRQTGAVLTLPYLPVLYEGRYYEVSFYSTS